jgi:hypothetical protein
MEDMQSAVSNQLKTILAQSRSPTLSVKNHDVSECRRLSAECSCATLFASHEPPIRTMLLSKEYVGYLAREVTKKLLAGKFIETKAAAAVAEKVHAAILDEFSLEDRINDEVRVILETYSVEMQKTGANYQEMFRKVKNELVRKYKAVL